MATKWNMSTMTGFLLRDVNQIMFLLIIKIQEWCFVCGRSCRKSTSPTAASKITAQKMLFHLPCCKLCSFRFLRFQTWVFFALILYFVSHVIISQICSSWSNKYWCRTRLTCFVLWTSPRQRGLTEKKKVKFCIIYCCIIPCKTRLIKHLHLVLLLLLWNGSVISVLLNMGYFLYGLKINDWIIHWIALMMFLNSLLCFFWGCMWLCFNEK